MGQGLPGWAGCHRWLPCGKLLELLLLSPLSHWAWPSNELDHKEGPILLPPPPSAETAVCIYEESHGLFKLLNFICSFS